MANTFSTNFNPAGSDSSGLLEDWKNTLKYKSPFTYTQPSSAAGGLMGTPYVAPTVDPINSGVYTDIEKILKLEAALSPLRLQEQQAQAKFGAEATRQQVADLFPYLDLASSRSKYLNEELSEKYAKFKDYLPTSQAARNVAAQGQMTSAAGAEADRDRATAAQAMAAKNFARSYIESLPSRA